MANIHKGEVPLEIDGTIYTLRLDFNALCAAESLGSKTVAQLSQDAEQGSFSALRVLFLAAVAETNSDMTLVGAGNLIEIAGIAAVMDAVSAAIAAAFPKRSVAENPK